jgi:hypothetical protein
VLRRFGLILLMAIPAVVAPWFSAKLADRFGQRFGAALASTLGGSWLAPAAVDAPSAAKHVPHEAKLPALPVPSVKPAALSRNGRSARPTSAGSARGLRVSGDTVLRLARSGVRPTGTYVPASRGCAAGLRLSGVGALGVGLRDGDVLTHAAGRPASSSGEVVGAVIGARGARQREVSGRFCRDGEAWNLVVEQPYPRSAAEIEGPVASREDSGR